MEGDVLEIGSYYRTVGGYSAYLMGSVPIGYSSPFPLRGFIRNKNGGWVACSWTNEGRAKVQAMPHSMSSKTGGDCFDLTPNQIDVPDLPETASLEDLLQDARQDHKKLALLTEFMTKLRDI